MKKLLLLFSAIIIFTCSSFSQQNLTRCYTMQKLDELKQADPGLENRMALIEQQTQEWISSHGNERSEAVYTIPVVVHIVYRTNAGNLSDARIQEQIDVLNEDFRRYNTDSSNTPSAFKSVAADTEIEFCLASRDPSGASTNGITRTQTSILNIGNTSNYYSTSNGGQNIWNRNSYLNIWVCEIGGGILGYAFFPGANASYDGVVIDYRFFGKTGATIPFNKGRTATHEVGHWFNLKHIWGNTGCGNGDSVSDTPTSSGPYYNCPSSPQTSCSSSDMFMNYMDYVNDNCMNTFTDGQRARMAATLNGTRSSLQSSLGCVGVGLNAKFTTPTTLIAIGSSIGFSDQTVGAPTSWSWTFAGASPSSSTDQDPTNITYNTLGSYNVTLSVDDGNLTHNLLKTLYIDVIQPVTSVNETNYSKHFNLYPNPSSGKVTLEVKLSESQNIGIRVYNILGALIHEKDGISSGIIEIDLNDQPDGLYFIELKTKSFSVVKKINLIR